uniref:CRAL-TRIO domain-containing protein n=1 Tax=Stomoxys calcitrans TaxID=35570 RepID=A0A1I8P6H3_STOCA
MAHFYPEGALQKVDTQLFRFEKYPELFKDLNLEMLKDYLHDFNGSMLPQRDLNGRRLYVALSDKYWTTTKWHRDFSLKSVFLQCDHFRSETETQICGIAIILDMEGLSVRQSLLYTVGFLKCLVDYIQNGMGIRFKGYHLVNQPAITNALYKMAKPFMQAKTVSRIHFHGKDMTSLHRHISPDCLPQCYGGTLKAAKQSYGPEIYELLKNYEKDYHKFSQYGYKKLI